MTHSPCCDLTLSCDNIALHTIGPEDYVTIAFWFRKVETYRLASGVDDPDLIDARTIAHLFDLKERLPNRVPLGIYESRTGNLLGFIDLWLHRPGRDIATIALFVVSPSVQGKGIGGQALQLVEDWWFGEGGTRIRAAVASENEGARRFFERHGYSAYRTERNALKIEGKMKDLEWYRKGAGGRRSQLQPHRCDFSRCGFRSSRSREGLTS